MVFGDSPTMRNDRYVPSIHAIIQSGNLFMYTMHNPVRWVDPDGTFVLCPVALYHALKYGYQLAKPLITKVGTQITKGLSWLGNAITGFFSGGGAVAKKGAVNKTINMAHNYASRIIDGTIGQGFETFRAAKKHLGDAAPGKVWHHIVEQSQIKQTRSGFDVRIIHNTHNLIQLPDGIHTQISAFYSSIPNPELVNTGGKVFRDWLNGKSFEVQFEWGIWVILLKGGSW